MAKKELSKCQIEINRAAAIAREKGLDGRNCFVYVQNPDGNYRRIYAAGMAAETKITLGGGITEAEYAEICKEPEDGENLNATYSWRLSPSF